MICKKLFLALAVVAALSSCKKFLERAPLDKLTPEQAFSNENNLELYVNSFYAQMLPDGPAIYKGDVMTDITVPNAVPSYIAGRLSSQEAVGWNWGNLRNINYFLEHYNNPAIAEKVRNHYGGIARYFRAYFYFNMVNQFGDVPWYSNSLAVDDPALYKGRDPRTLVMDSVLADINFACNNIFSQKDNSSTQVTRWVALALKARICLYEGTFRRYHPQFSLAGAEKWLQESAAAGDLLIKGGQYRLQNTGNAERDYRSLFISENPVSTEVLLAAVYNNTLKKWHDAGWWFNSATLGARLGLAKGFINTYLTVDGRPFTDLPGYDTMQFQTEVKNRDKRLQQTIRMGDYKRTDGSAAVPDFNVTYSGYQIQKFSLDDKYHDTRRESYNSIPIIRYAEVLLNYAEAKAELGTLTMPDWNVTIGALRSRAGIKNTTMPVTVDAYMKRNFYPDVTSPALMEIRRERAVELVSEGFRYDDLRRWKAGKLLEKVYEGIYVPAKGALLDLNEDGKPDVSFVDRLPANRVSGVVYFILDNNTSKLSGGDKGNLVWLSNIKKTFDESKHYLYPLPANEIILNPKLEQNPGW